MRAACLALLLFVLAARPARAEDCFLFCQPARDFLTLGLIAGPVAAIGFTSYDLMQWHAGEDPELPWVVGEVVLSGLGIAAWSYVLADSALRGTELSAAPWIVGLIAWDAVLLGHGVYWLVRGTPKKRATDPWAVLPGPVVGAGRELGFGLNARVAF